MDLSIWTESAVGPASYTAGGFVITTTLASVQSFEASISAAGANLGQVTFEYNLNSPVAGQVTVRPLRENYAKLTSMTDLTNLPSGISPAVASGQAFTGNTHFHALDHDHAVTPASTTPAGGVAGVVALVASPNATTHTHTLNLGNLVAATGTSVSHDHTYSFIYQHAHGVTNTATNVHPGEIAATTDLSGATLNYVGVGTV